jgi:histidyl-tRNA synthetase
MLEKIQDAFATCGINVDLDLCVIRSHEYYTSMSFEVDVIGSKEKFVEIAGGGRYDRLVSNFVHSNEAPTVVPCVGFAFGMERVIELLDQNGLYQKGTMITSSFDFGNSMNNVLDDEIIASIKQKLMV